MIPSYKGAYYSHVITLVLKQWLETFSIASVNQHIKNVDCELVDIFPTLKSCMLLALVQSQYHSEAQMGCAHVPKQCFSGNSQDKIAEKPISQL